MQAHVDSRIAAVAGSGPSAPESSAALQHRQPTPGSIAAAEAKLGEGQSAEAALAALGRARQADAAGDKVACERALGEALKSIGP